MTGIYQWLVANGLWRDLVSASILVPIMHLMALKPISKLIALINEIRVEAGEHRSLAEMIEEAKKD